MNSPDNLVLTPAWWTHSIMLQSNKQEAPALAVCPKCLTWDALNDSDVMSRVWDDYPQPLFCDECMEPLA